VCSSRSKVCSPSLLDGGARVRPGDDAPLRCVFHGGVGEAVAVTARRNNAPTLPCPAGFSLRCQRRVRELSFRSPASVLLRPVKVRGFCLEGAEQAGGPVVAWWLAQTRSSLGGDNLRRRALGQGRRRLGRVPDRWTFAVCFSYCGSSQSHVAMELLAAAGDGWWWRIPEDSACCGPMDLNVISSFFRGLCASRLVVQFFSVSYLGVSVFVLDFVLYP